MKKGDIVKGKITGIKPYGAFVRINDETDGLIHISEISDGFVRSIEDFFVIGDVVDLEVLELHEDNKVSLSFKRVGAIRKKKYVHIELKSGFAPLGEQLPIWIASYQKSGK
jgi:general stress protein 13